MGKKKEKSLEEKVLAKKISFSIKDIKWVIVTLVMTVLWIVTAILWVQDKNSQKEKISGLQTENNILTKKVATLEGQIAGVSQASEIFMQNSPSENRYRIELLENRVTKMEENGNITTIPISILDTTTVIRRTH